MGWSWSFGLGVVALAMMGCSSEGTDASGSGAGGGSTGSGAGGDAVVGPECPPPQVPSSAGCILPGVPTDGCGEGFSHDGDLGCVATLPDCSAGMVALPGETECRALAPCFDAAWTGLPSEPGTTTQYVDASYAGGDSDGTLAKPWTTIGEAITAADAGAVIAVAEGTYLEAVMVQSKPVKLWGQCPEKVTIDSTGTATLVVAGDAVDGTEVHTLSVTGFAVGIAVVSTADVLLDRVRAHDTGSFGVAVTDQIGPEAGVEMVDCLIEHASSSGASFEGAMVTMDRTVIRDVQPEIGTQKYGSGIGITRSRFSAAPTTVALARVVVEDTLDAAISVAGADVTIDDTLVRRTGPQELDLRDARGINVQPALFSNVTEPFLSTLILRGSVIEESAGLGVTVLGSAATIERVTVRDTLPRQSDGALGRGIEVSTIWYEMLAEPTAASATIRQSLVDDNADVGVLLTGAEVTVEDTAVRATTKRASDGQFGDGIAAMINFVPSQVSLSGVLLDANSRAGMATFGSTVSMQRSLVTCNVLSLNAESFEGFDAVLENAGDNACGCEGQWDDCKVLSSTLIPPTPAEPGP